MLSHPEFQLHSTYSIFVVFNNNSRKEEWRAIIMALFFGCKWHYCRVFLFRHEPSCSVYGNMAAHLRAMSRRQRMSSSFLLHVLYNFIRKKKSRGICRRQQVNGHCFIVVCFQVLLLETELSHFHRWWNTILTSISLAAVRGSSKIKIVQDGQLLGGVALPSLLRFPGSPM